MPRRNGPGEARGPRAPRIPDRRRAQRRQTLPLDEGEPHERRRVLQADVLRNREPPVPPDDARRGRVQPGVPVLLADARVGIEFSPGRGRPGVHRRRIDSRTTRTADGVRKTLTLLPTLRTRTVVRHTLVEGWNLGWEDEYAELDRLGKPMFIECKGYSFVGESRLRLQAENVPSHASIRTFAERLADRLGYRIAAEREDSRVVLLTQDGALHPIFQ